MRIAVISDIHGNLHALEAVLQAVDAAAPDEVWCLGDLVGYGPRPNECCAAVSARADLCLVGNHDLVVIGRGEVGIEEFNHDAAAAARWTRSVLADEAREYLSGLEPSAKRLDAELFHASPRDPVWDYVLSVEGGFDALALTEAPLVLVGHSHIALAISEQGGGIARHGASVDLAAGRWLLNPGSVGQPRDGDPRAAWLELDLDAGDARFHRVEYAIGETQAQMRAAALPPPLAARLSSGL